VAISGNGPSDVLNRRATLVTAAVRAALAWSMREHEVRAFEEIARMTGVVMLESGPGRGPTTPMELVAALRQPLGQLLAGLGDQTAEPHDGELDDVVLLTEDGGLSEAIYEVGCDYVHDLMATRDPGRDWLPSWAWMRANQVEQELFARLLDSGSEEEYRATRRSVVEYPAGQRQALTVTLNECGAHRVARYVEIPDDQVHMTDGGRWWWPCPVCHWPMRVDSQYVHCLYRPHHAVFQLQPAQARRRTPRLIAVDVSGRARKHLTVPQAQPAEGAVQVELAVWRYITVPGAPELRIFKELIDLGATVVLYPNYDRYDLDIAAGKLHVEVDIKEHATVEALVRHLRDKPPRARHIVLPRTHAAQADAVRDAFPTYVVWTEQQLEAKVRAALRRAS
jgi:hypothetical protein